jgi:hypothetical protein
VLELHLLLDLLVAVLTVPLAERMFCACTVELDAAGRTLDSLGGKWFVANGAICQAITEQTWAKLLDKA